MFENYFKTAIRSLLRQKFISLLNILGLAIGMASFIVISLWIKDELSYEEHFSNRARIYRLQGDLITNGDVNPRARISSRLANHLRSDYPHIGDVTVTLKLPSLMSYNGKHIYEENTFYADSVFFQVFSYPFLRGDRQSFNYPNGVVLDEETAHKMFGNEDPLGKVVQISNFGKHDTVAEYLKGRTKGELAKSYTVTGVIKKTTSNSHLHPHIIVPRPQRIIFFEYVYILFKKDFDPQNFVTEVWPVVWEKYFEKEYGKSSQTIDLKMLALKDIHLQSRCFDELEDNGSDQHVQYFSLIAVVIIIIVLVNYVNLTTASSAERWKEVGIRKVVGASVRQLILQFMTESIILAIIALLFALAFVELVLPTVNAFTNKALSLDLYSFRAIVYFVLTAFSVGIISGAYLAFYVSSVSPQTALRAADAPDNMNSLLRNGLVVFQLSLSVIMMICAMVVTKQLDFVKKSDLGFNKENVLMVRLTDQTLDNKIDLLKSRLLKDPNILEVAASGHYPGGFMHHFGFHFQQSVGSKKLLFTTMNVDCDYIRLLQLKLKEGAGFTTGMLAQMDTTFFVVLNESAVRFLGWESAVGKKISTPSFEINRMTGKCVGVVKDFHTSSFHERILPQVFLLTKKHFAWLSVRTRGKANKATLDFIEKTYKSVSDDAPFVTALLSDTFYTQYRAEDKNKVLLSWFAAISIFSCCLGLLGLASFSVKQKEKEIGIRKIAGASITNIVYHLSSPFIKLTFIAFVLAMPIAYYVMDNWLNNFAYRTTVGWTSFFISGLVLIVITFLTISFNAAKAVRQNLAGVLKHE